MPIREIIRQVQVTASTTPQSIQKTSVSIYSSGDKIGCFSAVGCSQFQVNPGTHILAEKVHGAICETKVSAPGVIAAGRLVEVIIKPTCSSPRDSGIEHVCDATRGPAVLTGIRRRRTMKFLYFTTHNCVRRAIIDITKRRIAVYVKHPQKPLAPPTKCSN